MGQISISSSYLDKSLNAFRAARSHANGSRRYSQHAHIAANVPLRARHYFLQRCIYCGRLLAPLLAETRILPAVLVD
jgi:hypothetical protein